MGKQTIFNFNKEEYKEKLFKEYKNEKDLTIIQAKRKAEMDAYNRKSLVLETPNIKGDTKKYWYIKLEFEEEKNAKTFVKLFPSPSGDKYINGDKLLQEVLNE